jgi:hypothetical protein
MRKKLIMLLILPLFAVSACKKDDDKMPKGKMLTINFTNLPILGANEQYEGWIMVNGSPVSTGTFTLNGDAPSKSSFNVKAEDLNVATDFILSIEPKPDADPAPSAIKIVGGSFNGKSASVNVNHAAALGQNFSTAAGKYIFATPTTSTMADELSGVWFLDLTSGSPMTGLNLPQLPAGWVYEGWVVINNTPLSTGTFTSVSAMDNSAIYSGSDQPGPPFPGEDFIRNAPSGITFPTNLSGKTVAISIEPSPDNSPMPFAFKPLIATAPANAEDRVTYNLNNQVSTSFPSGTVTR